jgi:hypothetical protein
MEEKQLAKIYNIINIIIILLLYKTKTKQKQNKYIINNNILFYINISNYGR